MQGWNQRIRNRRFTDRAEWLSDLDGLRGRCGADRGQLAIGPDSASGPSGTLRLPRRAQAIPAVIAITTEAAGLLPEPDHHPRRPCARSLVDNMRTLFLILLVDFIGNLLYDGGARHRRAAAPDQVPGWVDGMEHDDFADADLRTESVYDSVRFSQWRSGRARADGLSRRALLRAFGGAGLALAGAGRAARTGLPARVTSRRDRAGRGPRPDHQAVAPGLVLCVRVQHDRRQRGNAPQVRSTG